MELRARHALAAALPGTLPGRAVPQDNWHFTLAFLGDTDDATRERVKRELSAKRFGAPFEIELHGLGAFPRPARARVLWVGVGRGASALTAVAHKVMSACRRAGVTLEEREYSPHLTIARIDPPIDVRRVVRDAELSISASVSEVVLYRSHLRGGPARHEAVGRWPFAV